MPRATVPGFPKRWEEHLFVAATLNVSCLSLHLLYIGRRHRTAIDTVHLASLRGNARYIRRYSCKPRAALIGPLHARPQQNSKVAMTPLVSCWGGGMYSCIASHLTTDPRIPTMPGRSTSGVHRPRRHCTVRGGRHEQSVDPGQNGCIGEGLAKHFTSPSYLGQSKRGGCEDGPWGEFISTSWSMGGLRSTLLDGVCMA